MQANELEQICDDIATYGESAAVIVLDDDTEVVCRISEVAEVGGSETLFAWAAAGGAFRVTAAEVDRVIF